MNELIKANTKEITLHDAIKAPILKKVEKEHGKGVTVQMILQIVMDGVNAIGLEVTDKQLEIFSEDFLEVYYTDSLEDLVMMFKYLRRGELGTIYNRLDVPTLFEAYKKYLDKKWERKEKELKTHKESLYDRAALIASLIDKKQFTEPEKKTELERFETLKAELKRMNLNQLGLMLRYETNPQFIEVIQKEISDTIKK